VDEGEFVVIVGPSGCGKSTVLRIVAGLEDATSGTVEIDSKHVNNVAPSQRGIAMVFQSYALYPHLSVEGNMALALKQEGQPRDEIAERVQNVGKMLSLENCIHRHPSELSGGQRQRVAIGRAIVRQPRLFLFDEPLSNLDAALRVRTRLEIAKLHHELKATIVYVTHDQIEAMTLADKIVVLNEGRIEQVGTPMELYNDPANLFVAGFLGSPAMNFLPAEVVGGKVGQVTGIRPEYLRISENGRIPCRVVHIEKLGSDTNVIVDAGLDHPLTMRIFGQYEIALDARVRLDFDDADSFVFDADGDRIRQPLD
jgi:multiple sugar transport system ATP-binding protein